MAASRAEVRRSLQAHGFTPLFPGGQEWTTGRVNVSIFPGDKGDVIVSVDGGDPYPAMLSHAIELAEMFHA